MDLILQDSQVDDSEQSSLEDHIFDKMHDGQQMLPSGYSTISSTSDNEVDSNHNCLIQ